MHYVLMEHTQDPQGHQPVYVGASKAEAFNARDVAAQQYADRDNANRAKAFRDGHNCQGLVTFTYFFHRFTVVEVPETLPELTS